jgi:hypothetical protein
MPVVAGEQTTTGMVACAWCGAMVDDVPVTWTVQSSDRGVEYLCEKCTRENVRKIEGSLPTEWW